MAFTSAGLSIFIGMAVLIGWIVGMSTLTQFFTNRSAMQPITAVSAMVGGAGIIAAVRSHRATVTARQLVAVFLVVVATLTLCQYIFGLDLGIDHWLFAQAVAAQPAAYSNPGRMAEPTAAAFLLIGIGLFAVRVPGRAADLAISACATIVLLLVTVALISHLYAVAPLTGVLGFTQLSVPTALALAGLSIGLLCLRPGGGWVSLLVGNSVAAAAARWLLPMVVMVPLVVAWLALRGSEIGLYPSDFRLALTTAATIMLLASLALWGT